jgi:hypothetical protein
LNPFCPLANEHAFRNAFSTLLENPEFLAEGGTLGFGQRHVYPNDEELSNIYGMLKGIDAIVYRSARALRFQTVLYLFYEVNGDLPEGGLIEFLLDLDCFPGDAFGILRILRSDGGIVVCKHLECYRASLHFQERPEKVEWVTPKTTFNSRQSQYPPITPGSYRWRRCTGTCVLSCASGRWMKGWRIQRLRS